MAFSIPFTYTVGTGANNLVQLNGSGQLPAVSGANLTNLNAASIGSGTVSNTEYGYLDGVTSAIQTQLDSKAASTDAPPTVCGTVSSDTDYNGTSGSFTIEPSGLTITIPSTGKWAIRVLLNIYKASTGASTAFRLAMGTAAISGSTGYPAGMVYLQGGSATQNCTITTGSPTTVAGGSKSPGTNDLCLYADYVLNFTTAGTIKVQLSDGSATANILKLLATSSIKAVKLI